MNFLKKIFGISTEKEIIGLSSFSNNSNKMFDKPLETHKTDKKEATLTDLLRRTN